MRHSVIAILESANMLGLRRTFLGSSRGLALVQFLLIRHRSVPLGTGVVKAFRGVTQVH